MFGTVESFLDQHLRTGITCNLVNLVYLRERKLCDTPNILWVDCIFKFDLKYIYCKCEIHV